MTKTIFELLTENSIEVENNILNEVFKCHIVDLSDDFTKEETLQALRDELEIDKLDYSGAVHEQIDSSVDIYNKALCNWVGENTNWTYVEDAISEGLADGKDFMRSIMAGQFLQIQEEVYKELDEVQKLVDDML